MYIAVSSWSFHRLIYTGQLHLYDIPRAVNQLDLRHIELNDLFLAPIPPGRLARLFGRKDESHTSAHAGPDYGRRALQRVRQQRLRNRLRLVCWTIETDLTVAAAHEQAAQRAYIGTAIEAARFIGAPLLRLTLGGQHGERGALQRAIDLLRNILPVAIARGVRLAIENHGGLSSEIDALEEVLRAFRKSDESDPLVGMCLDFKHFADNQRIEGITRLAPLAIHVHAAADEFDAGGEEISIDYTRCLSVLREAGYDQAISIEYGGDGDPREGILKTRALIEKYWNA
jgi:sugar phosphate isomerase/epimerase